jgi:hypothetical protein
MLCAISGANFNFQRRRAGLLPPQQANSAMTIRAGQPAQAAEHRRARCRRGTPRGQRWHVLSVLRRHSGDESLWGRSPQGLMRVCHIYAIGNPVLIGARAVRVVVVRVALG